MPKEWSNQWISLSDMMTWLMLIFLLISILTISEIQKKEENKNKILIEYSNVREDIYKDLKKAFEEKSENWDMIVSDDLTIKFNNDELLFEANKSEIREKFKIILNEFIPKYFSVINNEKYSWKIKEIYIEWHASGRWCTNYLSCLDISQERANSVLTYIFNSEYFKSLSEKDKKKFEFMLTSSWFSSWRNLDKNWNSIFNSWLERNDDKSRRVEFRILTNSDELIEKILKNIK